MKRLLQNVQQQGWGAIGLVTGTVGAILIASMLSSGGSVPTSPTTITGDSQPTVHDVVERHLGWATQQGNAGVPGGVVPIREFFAAARENTGLFAEEVLGFNSKWTMVSDFLSGNQEHAEYLDERFRARLFTPEELEEIVDVAVAGYARYLEDVDAQLLVRLQADLAELPPAEFSGEWDRAALERIVSEALETSRSAVEADFQGMVGREIVSLVVGEILTAAGVELATSAGILTAGAGSGTMTFGMGLLIGIGTDFLVSEVYNEIYDPVGNLSRRLDSQLIELEQLMLQGNGETPGLEAYLQEYAARRSAARYQAIESSLQGKSAVVTDVE